MNWSYLSKRRFRCRGERFCTFLYETQPHRRIYGILLLRNESSILFWINVRSILWWNTKSYQRK